jgi:tetratricopeptide (TPR) repeat protein
MPQGLPRTALIGGAGVLVAFALFFGDGSTYPPLVWIGGLAVLAAAVGVALVLLGILAFPKLDGFGVAFLALLGWFVLWNGLSIVWSLQPDRSWEYFNRGIVYFAFALLGVLVGAASTRSVRAVALGLLVLFGAVLVWALLGKVIPNLVPDGERIARLREPLDYWNALALVGAMTLPLALWAAVRREHSVVLRVASVVTAFAAVVVVLLTYSRGGVVVALLAPAAYIALTRKRVEAAAALVVAVVPAAVLCLWAFQQPGLVEDGQPYDERLREGLWFAIGLLLAGAVVAGAAYLGVTHEERWRSRVSVRLSRRQLAVLAAVPVALIVLLFLVADPIDRARNSYREFTNPVTSAGTGPERLADFGSNSRWTWWGEAWRLWEDNPVAGTGAGTFSLARRPLRTNTTVATEPHNLALQFLSETGLVGFLLAAGAGVAAAFGVVRALRRLDEPEAAAGLALAVLALAYLAHAVIDYDWDFVGVSAPLFLVLGVLVAAGRPAIEAVREPFFAGGAVLLGIAVLASLASPWLASRGVADAYAALERRDADAAVDTARRARTLNPLAVEPLFAQAVAEEARGNDGEALELYIRAVELQPENSRTWFELGRFELDAGLRDPGIRHLLRSRELDRWGPSDPVLGRLGI